MLHPIVRYFPHARRWTATDRYELVLTSGAEEQRFFHERLCNTVGCSDLNGLASACGVGTLGPRDSRGYGETSSPPVIEACNVWRLAGSLTE
jgi:hypothetical protein